MELKLVFDYISEEDPQIDDGGIPTFWGISFSYSLPIKRLCYSVFDDGQSSLLSRPDFYWI